MTATIERRSTKVPLWKNPGPDGGWSWIIITCNWIFLAVAFGLCTTGSIGILFVEFISVFGISRKEAAWPFSLFGIMQSITGLFAGVVNTYLDLRTVVLLSAFSCTLAMVLCFFATNMLSITLVFGIFMGCGNGLYMSTSLLYMNQYFKRYLATANGIFMVASPVAGLVLPYLVHSLVKIYGLRGAFLLIGGLTMQLLVLGCLMRPRTSKHFPCLKTSVNLITTTTAEGAQNPPPEKLTKTKKFVNTLLAYKDVLSSPMFYVVTVQAVVSLNVFVGISLTLLDFAVDNDISRENGILLLAVFSGADIVGRVTFGFLSDYGCIHRARLSLMSMFLMGAGLLLFSMRKELVWFSCFGVVLGLNEGGLASTANVLYTQYLERKNLPAAFGLRLCFNGAVAFLRPLFAGFFRDTYSSYVPFYYLLGAMSLFSSFLWALEPYIMRKKTTNSPMQQVNLELNVQKL